VSSKTFLVTGGTGFIGAALVIKLLKAGHAVRILDNGSRGSHRRLLSVEGEYDLVEGDVRDCDTFERAARGVDSVCHLAFVNGTAFFYSMPEVVLDVGVKGMINAIDVCKKLNIGELIVASSSEVYQNPPSIPTDETVPLVIPDVFNPRYSYGAGKILSEVMAINYGRKFFERVIVFRPHNVYGPDMGWEHVVPQFVMRLKDSCTSQPTGKIAFPIQGSGSQTRAFVYIEDAANALMLILHHGKHLEIYNVGNEKEVTIAAVAELIAGYFKREIEILPGAPAKGSTERRCPDITKLRKLGFEPKVSLAEGIDLTASWYNDHPDLAHDKTFVLQ